MRTVKVYCVDVSIVVVGGIIQLEERINIVSINAMILRFGSGFFSKSAHADELYRGRDIVALKNPPVSMHGEISHCLELSNHSWL